MFDVEKRFYEFLSSMKSKLVLDQIYKIKSRVTFIFKRRFGFVNNKLLHEFIIYMQDCLNHEVLLDYDTKLVIDKLTKDEYDLFIAWALAECSVE